MKAKDIPGASLLFVRHPKHLALIAFLIACAWTALEWTVPVAHRLSLESLGVSQYARYD